MAAIEVLIIDNDTSFDIQKVCDGTIKSFVNIPKCFEFSYDSDNKADLDSLSSDRFYQIFVSGKLYTSFLYSQLAANVEWTDEDSFETYLRSLNQCGCCESGGGGTSPYFLEITYQTEIGGITANTVVHEYDIEDGETAGLRVENVARRGTGATGAYGEYAIHAQRIGGSTTLSTISTSFNSSSYGVGISFAVSGTKVQIIATVSGGIAINHKGIIRILKM